MTEQLIGRYVIDLSEGGIWFKSQVTDMLGYAYPPDGEFVNNIFHEVVNTIVTDIRPDFQDTLLSLTSIDGNNTIPEIISRSMPDTPEGFHFNDLTKFSELYRDLALRIITTVFTTVNTIPHMAYLLLEAAATDYIVISNYTIISGEI